MKTISRVMIILLAATLIGGVTYAIGHRMGAAQATFRAQGGERFAREAGPAAAAETAGQPPRPDQRSLRPEHRDGGRGGFDHGGGRGFGFFGLLGLARTIVPIALIIGVVLLASNGLGRFFNRRKGDSTPVAATAGPVDVTPTDGTEADVAVADVAVADVAEAEATPADVVSADVTPTDPIPTEITPTGVTPTDVTTTDIPATDIMTTDPAPVAIVPPETPSTDDQSPRA